MVMKRTRILSQLIYLPATALPDERDWHGPQIFMFIENQIWSNREKHCQTWSNPVRVVSATKPALSVVPIAIPCSIFLAAASVEQMRHRRPSFSFPEKAEVGRSRCSVGRGKTDRSTAMAAKEMETNGAAKIARSFATGRRFREASQATQAGRLLF